VGRAEASVTGFENILDVLEQGLPLEVHFVLSTSGIDKRRNTYKRITKLANTQTHDKPDTSRAGWEGAVLMQAQAKARELGITFESGALELVVQMAGDDTRQLENELDGDRPIPRRAPPRRPDHGAQPGRRQSRGRGMGNWQCHLEPAT